MFEEKLVGQVKQHPFAMVLFVLYMAFWIAIYCLLFIGGVKVGDVALSALPLSIMYSLFMLTLALLTKKHSTLYLWLTYLIYIPIITTIIIILPLL
jgi:hypothetical protein